MDVKTASSTGQLTTSAAHIRMVEWHARASNKDTVVVGMSDVAVNNGRELSPDERVTWNFSDLGGDGIPGYLNYNELYVQINRGGDRVDYTVFLARD